MPKPQFLTIEPPRCPRRAAVFRLARPRVDQKRLLKMARDLGLKGNMRHGSICHDAREMTYTEGSHEVVLYRASGGLRFHDNARWQLDDGKANVTFDDATAARMGERYIEAHAFAPLDQIKLLRVTRLHVAVAEGRTGYAQQRIIDAGVIFQRMVDDIDVIGPGGKVVVYLDQDGAATGVDRIWREIEGVHESDVELQTWEFAQQDVERHWGERGSGLATLDGARFGYVELGWTEEQRFLQPAYLLDLTITAAEGLLNGQPIMRTQHVVPAAKRPPEPIVSPPPDPQPQPPRPDGRPESSES